MGRFFFRQLQVVLSGMAIVSCSENYFYRGETCELGFWKNQRFYSLVHILYDAKKTKNSCELYTHLQRENLRKQCQQNEGDDYGWRIERLNGTWDREKYACHWR